MRYVQYHRWVDENGVARERGVYQDADGSYVVFCRKVTGEPYDARIPEGLAL